MMKTISYSISSGLLLMALLMGCGGGGGGGSDSGRNAPNTAAEAEEIANDIIVADYPEMERVTPQYQGYESSGNQIHEFTYIRTIEVVSNGTVVEIPHNVVVSVDQDSGETEVYESN